MAGLRALVEECAAQVFVPPAGIGVLERTCPAGTAIFPADELPGRGWFPVVVTPLHGRGAAPMAYRVKWAGKTVLFSGPIPIRANGHTDAALLADIAKSRDVTLDYLGSVYRLAGRQAGPMAAGRPGGRPECRPVRQRVAGRPGRQLSDRIPEPDAASGAGWGRMPRCAPARPVRPCWVCGRLPDSRLRRGPPGAHGLRPGRPGGPAPIGPAPAVVRKRATIIGTRRH